MEDLYIGQNDTFGVWVQQVMGGYRVLVVARSDEGEAPADEAIYSSVEIASQEAKRLLNG